MTSRPFFDSNVALYLLSADVRKAERAEDLISGGGTISVQVLNEFIAVARRKHAVPWPAVERTLESLKRVCEVEPLTLAVHDRAVALAKRFRYTVYDATIVASALQAGCDILYSEHLQRSQRIETLTIVDPFR